MAVISHDPFSRTSVDRLAAGSGDCHECGSYKKTLYTYTVVADDRMRPLRQGPGKRFCSVGCWRIYNS